MLWLHGWSSGVVETSAVSSRGDRSSALLFRTIARAFILVLDFLGLYGARQESLRRSVCVLINWLVPFRCSRKSLYFPRVYILFFRLLRYSLHRVPGSRVCPFYALPVCSPASQLEMSLEDIMFAAIQSANFVSFRDSQGILKVPVEVLRHFSLAGMSFEGPCCTMLACSPASVVCQ
jgi:hypothetical protein